MTAAVSGVSERRSCQVLGVSRAGLHRPAGPERRGRRTEPPWTERLHQLIQQHPTFGYRRLQVVHEKLVREDKLGPALRLLPTTAATTIRGAQNLVIDGPFAETKEQLLGFYVIDVPDLDAALAVAMALSAATPTSCDEIRPIAVYVAGRRPNAPTEMIKNY